MPVAAFALSLLQYLPMAIEGVTAATDMFAWGKDALDKMNQEKRDPTPAEWDELNRLTSNLREMLHSDTM